MQIIYKQTRKFTNLFHLDFLRIFMLVRSTLSVIWRRQASVENSYSSRKHKQTAILKLCKFVAINFKN